MYKLTISIPTRNRPEFIDYYLKTIFPIINSNISIYIVDSSDNDLTEKVINKFNKYTNLYYKKISPAKSLDEKCYQCMYNNIDTEYIWLCGDKMVINESILHILLEKYLNEDFSLIVLSNRDEKNIGIKYYESLQELFKDCAWDMTLFGSTIVNRRNIIPKPMEYYKTRYSNNLFSTQYHFDCKYTVNKFIFIPNKFYTLNICSNGSFWGQEVFYTFIDEWMRTINLLPTIYDPYKKEVIKDHGVYSKLFSYKVFLKHRMTNNLNLKTYLEYKDKFKYVTNVKNTYLLILCLIPKFILSSLNRIHKLVIHNES